MKTFSFIIPVYNAEKNIERCVKSILANNCDDVEIILIEDCSKDGSWQVCQELAAAYENVIALHNEENRKVSYTRNRGLDAATGQYILFTDSDDWVDPAYVDTFRRAVEQGVPLAICGYVNHDEKANGRTDIVSWDGVEGTKRVPLRENLKYIQDKTLLQQLWNKVFIADIIKTNNVRFDESISIGEDLRFILDYIRAGDIDDVLLIDQPLYHYMRDQAGSLMYRVGYESIEEPLKNMRTLYELMGVDAEEIDRRIEASRETQKEAYAYFIMHNMGMPLRERRRLILALDDVRGKKLYRENLILFCKEKVGRVLKRHSS